MSLRELVWMYAGKRREAWMHSANLMALVANCHRSPKRIRPFHLVDFLPADLRAEVRRTSGIPLTAKNLRMLKPMFTKET
jgi:hypothetical protein